MPWRIPREDLDQMDSMFEAGLRADVLADAFGISARAIHFRLDKRGLHYRRPRTRRQELATQNRQGLVNALRGRGLTLAQMASHLRIQVRTMRAWFRRHTPDLYGQLKAEALAGRRARRPPPPPTTARPTGPATPLPLTKWRRASIKRAYVGGATIAQIARRYGHHTTTIWRLLRRQGVCLRARTAHRPGALRARASG